MTIPRRGTALVRPPALCTFRQCVRRAGTDAKPAYGAPYTNSVSVRPTSSAGGAPLIAGADMHVISVSIPDLPLTTLTVFGKDSLDFIAQKLSDGLQVRRVFWVVNGQKFTPGTSLGSAGEPATLNNVFGSCAELEVDGQRFSVNEGAVLTALGKASKRSLALTYTYVGVGGVIVLVACLKFWQLVVPVAKQRRMS